MQLARISKNFLGQPMFQRMAKINHREKKGHKIIHLEIGEPDFQTPTNIKDKAIEMIKKDATHYCNSYGLENFRTEISKTTHNTRGFKPNLNQILVTTGGNAIIYLLIKTVLNSGDEILIPNPGFPTYISAAKANNVKIKYYSLDIKNNFQIDISNFKNKISKRTKLLILNSPSNPLGVSQDEKILREIYKICKKKNILILSDEIYSRIVFNEQKFFSISSIDKCQERVIVLNGFSKAFAMTGWRLGVCLGPEFIINKMNILLETIVSCVPPFIQFAGLEAISGDQKYVKNMVSEYKNRRDLVCEALDKLNNLKFVVPDGAIYLFPNTKKLGVTGEEFSDICLKKLNLGVLPGKFFGSNGNYFFRMSFASNSSNLKTACKRIYEYFN